MRPFASMDPRPENNVWWHLDRLNQARLPLDGIGANEGPYIGRGVNIFHFDTGIDITHEEFASLPGEARTVANVASFSVEDEFLYQPEWGWNEGNIVYNNDRNGHGKILLCVIFF